MALPPSFAVSTANSIFDRTIKSAEAIFMKPLSWDPSSREAFYDRESFLKCGAALVGKFVLTLDFNFAEVALERLLEVLNRDHGAKTQCFVESRSDIQRAFNLENSSDVQELCRRCEDIILRVQKAVLKERNPTESIRSICNYLSSADEQLDETTMVDFEDLVERLRKVADRRVQLKHNDRKFRFCHYDSDGEEDNPLRALVTSMVIMQGSVILEECPAKDGGGSCASSADGEENNVEKTIEGLVDFTQFAIFEFFRRSSEEIHDNDDRNAENLTMSGAAWLGRSLLEKSSEDVNCCLQTAVLKLGYALEMAPNKTDALFYIEKAFEAIDLLK